ncbi:MAG: hypothetical protein HZC36_02170 [Armatimonadetes bacterium]|nr:hypothetical protein [Armatimonadota bacterium]
MIRRRGYTLVEAVLAVVLAGMVIGTLLSLYSLVASRTARSYTEAAAVYQASTVVESLTTTIANATDVSLQSLGGGTAIKCIMPATGRYANGDGIYEWYEPEKVIGLSQEKFNTYSRIWFYFGNEAGAPSATGQQIHMAVRSDDTTPSAADVLWSWEHYPGTTKSRFDLISTWTLSIDDTQKALTLTVTASTLAGSDHQASTAVSSADKYEVSISRMVMARNARL